MTETKPQKEGYVEQFAPGVERVILNHFPEAAFTVIPAAESLATLVQAGMNFSYHPGLQEGRDIPSSTLEVASQAVYLKVPRSNSWTESYDALEEDELQMRFMRTPIREEDRHNVQIVLSRIPEIRGVRWEIPQVTTLSRILLNDSQSNNGYLLSQDYVWTSDEVETARHDRAHLVVGHFGNVKRKKTLDVSYLPNGLGEGRAAVFIVGFPEQLPSSRGHLRVVER